MASLLQLLNQASNDGSIADMAERARQLLVCCQEIRDEGSRNISSAQLARFNLWASNIGVFAGRHASLDYRLRTSPTVRVTVEGNLEIICRHLLSTLKATSELSDKELDAFFDLPKSQIQSYGARLLRDSISNEEFRAREMGSVEEMISTLHQLSLAIRKASNRNSLTKLPRLFDFDSGFVALRVREEKAADSGTTVEAVRFETTSTFEDYVRKVLESRWLRPSHEAEIDPEQKGYRNALFDRCVAAVINRRRQLTYFRKHQLKLAQRASAKPVSTAQQRHTDPNTGEQLTDEPERNHVSPVGQGLQVGYEASNADVSDTVGSGFLSATFRLAPPSSAPSSTTSSTADAGFGTGGPFAVPPPPKLDDEEKEKACPYCCLVLPARTFSTLKKAKRWERHLLEDLKPYLCLFANCSQPGKSYSSFQEWQAHLSQPHSHSWLCPLHAEGHKHFDNDSLVFDSAAKFEIHLSMYHADLEPSATKDLVHRATRVAVLPQWCFVCFEGLPSLPSLQKHMANHFKSMSLLALPWLDDIREEEGLSSDKLMDAPEGSVASHPSQIDLAGSNLWESTDTDAESSPFPEPARTADAKEFASMLSAINANPVKTQDRLRGTLETNSISQVEMTDNWIMHQVETNLQGKDASGQQQIGKIRRLKKEDGEPLWREDIQYDFLKAVFDNESAVFTNSYDYKMEKQTFADLYIDTISRSTKTNKVLRDKILSDREAAKGIAMVCLLVNMGRISTALNFIPEMRAQLRTYHAIPSLQAHQDVHAYKQLQDAPRLKSILKGGAEDRNEPNSLDKIKGEDVPRTNPVNLIFVMCNTAQKIAELHFPRHGEFYDLIMKTQYTSKSRANAFLWLMWFYLESDFTEEGSEENPFGPGVDYGLDVANQGVPVLDEMTDEEKAKENVDTTEEIEFGRAKQMTRAKIMEMDQAYQAYLNERETKRGKIRPSADDWSS